MTRRREEPLGHRGEAGAKGLQVPYLSELVEALGGFKRGALPALVWQQVEHWSADTEDGWVWRSLQAYANVLHCGRTPVDSALKTLIERCLLERSDEPDDAAR